MKVKCITNYHDILLHKDIKAGEELEVADARGAVLLKANVAVAVTTTTTTTPEVAKPAPKPRKKKTEDK